MTSRLSDALRTTTATDHALQIVTPPTTRLTLPTRTALPNRWVVQDPERGYYDDLSGAALHWKNGTFTPVRNEDGTTSVAEAFKAPAEGGERQPLLTLRTRHPADADLVLGGALEAVLRHLTGASPAGWSTAEPVNLPWSTRQLTDLARARAPRPSWLIAVGHPDQPALTTMRVLRTTAGVEEDITLALGYRESETPPPQPIDALAAELNAEHGLVTMLTALRAARHDLTVPARLEPPPIPVPFTLGHDEARRIDPPRAEQPPLGLTPTRLGAPAKPALHYPLGDGTERHAWSTFQRLTQHLKQQA
ncbi:DUF6177 family protein [Streptomyces chartreusis]|uniref:DUF6177 family protein n=1 Tax=Streptomyces chartreusis TaxID=1969 RepID=UPI0036BADA4B